MPDFVNHDLQAVLCLIMILKTCCILPYNQFVNNNLNLKNSSVMIKRIRVWFKGKKSKDF